MKTIHLNEKNDFLIWRQGSGNTIEIYDIAVNSERGEGNGRKLVNQLLTEIPKETNLVFAITRNSNKIAQEFYVGIGFRLIARLEQFYETESALMYGIDL